MHSPTAAEARALQPVLAARVEEADRLDEVRLVAGVDVSTTRFDPERLVHAAVVLLAWPGLEVVETATAVQRAALPYIPGLLGFREVPALQEAFTYDGQQWCAPKDFSTLGLQINSAAWEAAGLTDTVPFLLQARLEELGAKHTAAADFQSHVVSDGRLVTGQNPASSAEAADVLLALLNETAEA